MSNAQWLNSRGITDRWIIQGDLELLSPANFGNGETTDQLDLPLYRDSEDGSALLTGSSLAGALRNYLLVRELGYMVKEKPEKMTETLFGFQRGEEGEQSNSRIHQTIPRNPNWIPGQESE